MCHECARQSIASAGVGQCRFCLVSLCDDHLVESLRSDAVPRYACNHRPELPFDKTKLYLLNDTRDGAGTTIVSVALADLILSPHEIHILAAGDTLQEVACGDIK